MATKPKTKKLVYTATQVAVKQNDKHTIAGLGPVIVDNIRSPRKKHGSGRVTLKTIDGRLLDYTPAIINASWI